ncbi:MAG: SAM-dependent chlorinase/fluorinase [Myxococcales bacterium]|nr:SAM-dependent chlorinase/fluorinase [Myxococcales bacterium]
MIITLTTDFGLADGYVGAMKGVIYSLVPRATVVDITHEVPPFDVGHGAFALAQAAPFFPPETVHVAVVDPGVGGSRRGIVAVWRRQLFVGPDNGLFSPFLEDRTIVRELADPDLWLPDAAPTFHGRDLFAPAAARLAGGLPVAECGPAVTDPVRLPDWEIRRQAGVLIVAVAHVDRFGNCITALPASRLEEIGPGPCLVEAPGLPPLPLSRTYDDVPHGQLLALIGSHGFLELAVREGSAAALGFSRGTIVRVRPAS